MIYSFSLQLATSNIGEMASLLTSFEELFGTPTALGYPRLRYTPLGKWWDRGSYAPVIKLTNCMWASKSMFNGCKRQFDVMAVLWIQSYAVNLDASWLKSQHNQRTTI